MQLTLSPSFPPLRQRISYQDTVLLTGSCFTEHIHDRLAHHKFRVMGNPNGILFNPLSVADSMDSYLSGRRYIEDDLFCLNELWNSWDHHTRFSDTDPGLVLEQINRSQEAAGAFLRKAGFVIITLGSAFQYYLKESGRPVSNNHRAPAQWFEKKLLDSTEITEALSAMLNRLLIVNPEVQILFTISPVRHIRDGVIDNNRSKARLIESVHELCGRYAQAHYFPAYELVIDILRDYRFFDIDFVHPNYLATSFVWEQFAELCLAPEARPVMKEVEDIMTARSHRPRFPGTEAHSRFREEYRSRVQALMQRYPFLDLRAELDYFS